jgi:cellulose synthase operon protein C
MLRPRSALAAALLAAVLATGTTGAPGSSFGPRPAAAWSFDWIGHVELDAEGLTAENPSVRVAAVQALAAYDINLTERYLLGALTDAALEVRLDAARALGRGRSQRAVPTLIEWLGDIEPKTRVAAAEALGDIGGPQASAALARSLGDPDHGVRQRAVRAIGAIGQRGDRSAVIALLPRLSDDKADVRRETVEQLEAIGDGRAVIPLVAAFVDNHPEVRKAAVRAVGRFGNASVVPALLRLLRDPSEDVRSAAVGSLGAVGSADAIGALSELLTTGSDLFRSKVAYALGQIARDPSAGKAGEAALERLVAALATPSLRTAAREALRVAGPAAIPALLAHLAGKLPGDPATAVQLLSKAADARATAALTAELERRRVAQPIVLMALGATGDPAALVPVLGALSSRDPEIRLAAMNAMRPLLGEDGRASDVLIERLADADLEVRVLAAEYLGLVRASQGTDPLLALTAAGTPPRLRHAAIDALGAIGDPRALPALLGLLREGSASLRPAAATAIAYLGAPAAIAPLLELVTAVKASWLGDEDDLRRYAVRALGGSLRAVRLASGASGQPPGPAAAGTPAARAIAALTALATEAETRVAVAAIGALAAAGDPSALPALRTLASRGAPDRRRAALLALADLADLPSLPLALEALSARDDRVAADAAWTASALASRSPPGTSGMTEANREPPPGRVATWDRLAFAARHGGWGTQINATAGLAALAGSLPPNERTAQRLSALHLLTFHRSALVRTNVGLAVLALGEARGDELRKDLVRLLGEHSPHQRAALAASLALQRDQGAKLPAELTAALTKLAADPSELVRAAVAVKPPQEAQLVLPPRWRIYEIVDADAGDAPVRQQRYFLHGEGQLEMGRRDRIVRALYTDPNGELVGERMPGDSALLLPASREGDY